MERNFSQHVKEILGYSREEAERLQNSNIVPEHLLLGIIRDGANRAVDVLVGLGASLRTLKSSLENELSASNNHMEKINGGGTSCGGCLPGVRSSPRSASS